MEDFSSFIDIIEVVDLPTVGNQFTWFSTNGRLKSRLDHFLVSEGIIDKWKHVAQEIGNRDVSDHCPIWIKRSNVSGMRAFTLKEKFKLLKADLKKWNIEVFGITGLKVDNAIEDLSKLDCINSSIFHQFA
ncbi:unnamed protein product [Lathyrus sativus]|nr:unnamed protein product [Lathyrus sativus]